MSVNRNVLANYFASGWSALVGLAFVPLYIRYLGIESYGLIGFFATLQAWSMMFDMGLSTAVNREIARHSAGVVSAQGIRNLLKSIEVIYAILAGGLVLLVAALSPLIAGYWLQAQALSIDTVAQAVMVMGLAIGFQWMAALYRSAILGLQHQVWITMEGMLAATVRAGGAMLVLAYISPTIVAFLLFQCAIGAVESIVLGWYVHRHLPRSPAHPKFSLEALRTVWRFAGGLWAVMVLATLLTQLDKLLLARLLPLAQFGYFTLAVTIAGALSLLVTPINNVAFPSLSHMAATKDQVGLAKQYHRFAQLLSIGIIPPALVLCLFSETIVLLWTGDPHAARRVAPLLSLWVVGTMINGLMYVPYAAQLAHGWPQLSAKLNGVAVLVMVPALLFFVPRHGAMAAAWVWVAINLGYLTFGVGIMHTRILVHEKWNWYTQDVLGPILASGLTALAMFALHSSSPGMSRAGELGFLLAATMALVLAAALAAPLGRRSLGSIAGLLLGHAR